MSLRALVLCADDFGISGGVSRAILDLAEMDRVSGTGAMTNLPGWRIWARTLDAHAGRIGIGLHLNLTWGTPLTRMPGFAPGGVLPSLQNVVIGACRGLLPIGEIEAEIAAQFDAFGEAARRLPDFVDGHQHVHALPGVRGALLRVLVRRGDAGRLWLRNPGDRARSIIRRRLAAPKALVVAALGYGFARVAGRAGFDLNEGFSGFSPFDPARDPGSDFAAYLRALGPRPLMMCHPGRAEDAPADGIAPARARELAYLGSEAFADLLAREGISLVPSPASIRALGVA